MNRREFVAMVPAFPVAAVTASLTLLEEGKEPLELDVSVLKMQPGDTLVLQCDGDLPLAQAERIKEHVETRFPSVKALVLSGGLKLEGVIRGLA